MTRQNPRGRPLRLPSNMAIAAPPLNPTWVPEVLLPLNVLFDTVTLPPLAIAPPANTAELLMNTQFVMVSAPPADPKMAPPMFASKLLVVVLTPFSNVSPLISTV